MVRRRKVWRAVTAAGADVLLAKGVKGKYLRPNYLLWEEPLPSLVVEVTSKKTKREDQGK